jgi:hypothetical protein
VSTGAGIRSANVRLARLAVPALRGRRVERHRWPPLALEPERLVAGKHPRPADDPLALWLVAKEL